MFIITLVYNIYEVMFNMNIGDEVIYNGETATVSAIEDSESQWFNMLLNFDNERWQWVAENSVM